MTRSPGRDIVALAHTGSGAAVSRVTMAAAKRPTSEEAVAPLMEVMAEPLMEVMAELVRKICDSIEQCSYVLQRVPSFLLRSKLRLSCMTRGRER